MQKISTLLIALGLTMGSAAQAATFDFTGTISNHNDVIRIPFSLINTSSDVKVWTDSFLNGLNFDPITAVWKNIAGAWTKVGENDDNAGIAAGQTIYDSGLTFSSLDSGDYLFTIATYNNFSVSGNLNDGFSFDNQTPIALANWTQPANHAGMGNVWSVHLSGVDSAIAPVPEPETYALTLLGMGLLGMRVMRSRQRRITPQLQA